MRYKKVPDDTAWMFGRDGMKDAKVWRIGVVSSKVAFVKFEDIEDKML